MSTVSNNNFEENFAFVAGGALKWDDVEPTFSKNTFRSNKANQYGDNIAGVVHKIISISESDYLKKVPKSRLLNEDLQKQTLKN